MKAENILAESLKNQGFSVIQEEGFSYLHLPHPKSEFKSMG